MIATVFKLDWFPLKIDAIFLVGVVGGFVIGLVYGFFLWGKIKQVSSLKCKTVGVTDLVVTQFGSKFHVDKRCAGLLKARTAKSKAHCLICCPEGLLVQSSD